MWKYYDFENNWDAFHKVWQSYPVQEVLKPEMDDWCDDVANIACDENTGDFYKPVWKCGDDLWKYSRSDFHLTRIMQRADDHVHKHNWLKLYKIRRKDIGIPFSNDITASNSFVDLIVPDILEYFEPIRHSWEANVLYTGANVLAESQKVAFELFLPNSRPIVFSWHWQTYALLPEEKIVIDFSRAFKYKTDPSHSVSAQFIGKLWEKEKFQQII